MEEKEKRPRPATTFDQVIIPKNEVRPWKEIGSRRGVSIRVVAWEDEPYVHEYPDEQGRIQVGAPGVVPEGKTRVEIRYSSLQALAEFRREISQWRASQITPK